MVQQMNTAIGTKASVDAPSITPILDNSSFDPEDIENLVLAFDAAWKAVKSSGGTLSRSPYARPIREVLAKRIIEMARRGQSNPHSLCEDAVQFLSANYRS
jgi:hypothetical protein